MIRASERYRGTSPLLCNGTNYSSLFSWSSLACYSSKLKPTPASLVLSRTWVTPRHPVGEQALTAISGLRISKISLTPLLKSGSGKRYDAECCSFFRKYGQRESAASVCIFRAVRRSASVPVFGVTAGECSSFTGRR